MNLKKPILSPHQINHDHKYQSRKFFSGTSKSASKGGRSASPPPPPYWTPDDIPLGGGPPSNIQPQRVIKDNRKCNGNIVIINICTGWGAIGILVILAIIVVPVVLTHLPKHNPTATSGNPATVVSTFTQTQTPTTILVAPSNPTSSLPSTTHIPNAGFDVYNWADDKLQIFYQNPTGSQGSIYSSQFIAGAWSNPAVIASDAMPGSTLSISVIENVYTSDGYGSQTSTDINYVLQDLEKEVNYNFETQDESVEISGIAGSKGWKKGTLGSYGFKTSTSLYQRACTWWGNYSDSGADLYVYFDSAAGSITKIGYYTSTSSWIQISDMPAAFSGSNIAVECSAINSTYESLWTIEPSGTLQQYWTVLPNLDLSGTTWNTGFGYEGPFAPNTSLGIASDESFSLFYYQAPDGSIMQLMLFPVENASFSGAVKANGSAVPIVTGSLGTRIATAGAYYDPSLSSSTNSTISLFYQNGGQILRELLQVNAWSGDTINLHSISVINISMSKGDLLSLGLLLLSFSIASVFLL